ncbi:uncharacterized protein MONOS_18441 [Monocercomonoides exilis]|uniref:uncharacterized protein n=1 Tax=Monocercomonoides exilis TaxID=2049356 RepID=UPI003559B8B1|nr:hypothetical protein MONOS_18441 [Monocercomonoides exilis]
MGGGLSHSGGSTSSIATVSSESITVSSTNTYSPLSTESSLPSSIMTFMQPSSLSYSTSSMSEYGPVSHNSIFRSIGAISRNVLSLDKISMGIARSGSVLIQPPPEPLIANLVTLFYTSLVSSSVVLSFTSVILEFFVQLL